MKYLIILLIILATGCKAKHKTVSKHTTKTALSEMVETKTIENVLKTVDSLAIEKKTSVTIKDNEFVNVLSDSTGVVTIEEVLTPQGKRLVFTGVKSVSIGKNKSQEVTSKESTVELSKTEDKEKTATELSETASSTETTKKNTDIKKVGFDPLVAVGIGIGVILVLVYLYLRRKKRLFIR